MRRAVHVFALALSLAALSPAALPAEPQIVDRINGIGLIDYMHRPDFKVGTWARYHMTGHSELGMTDSYDVTVLIAGEEEWWGERCFWVETWTDAAGRGTETTATLMSYDIFGDSLATPHMQFYMRKSISGLEADGRLHQDVTKRASQSLKSRTTVSPRIKWDVDTLGVDTVQTAKGVFQARKVSLKQGTGATTAVGDTSIYTEVRENRMSFYSNEVPITHLVREDVESTIQRKKWQIGRSQEATPLMFLERGLGSARLVDFGQGQEARLVPAENRSTIEEQRARAKRTSAVVPPALRKRTP